MDKAYLISQTVPNTKDSGKTTLCMDSDSLRTEWEGNGKVSTEEVDLRAEARAIW